MRVFHVASSALSGAVYGALTPILALVFLAPAEYGLFSIVYLIYAFGISLQYSIISEAWARSSSATGRPSTWAEYSTALSALSGIVGLAGLIASFSLPQLSSSAWILAFAVACAVYRNGARYHRVTSARMRRVIISDLAGIIAFIVAVLCSLEAQPLLKVSVSWLAASLVGALVLQPPRLALGVGLIHWVRRHGTAIGPLLMDSLLMDAGSIGTPFLLAGFLGPARFGTYRAVANVSMPVRLLVEPMRPLLGSADPKRLFGKRLTTLIALIALILTTGCYVALAIVVPDVHLRIGTLSSLAPYALPSSVFVAGNLLGSVYYIPCRTNATRKHIMFGRICQTLLVVITPIIGFAVWDLGGAIWGFAVSSVISAAVWINIAHMSGRALTERQNAAGRGELLQ